MKPFIRVYTHPCEPHHEHERVGFDLSCCWNKYAILFDLDATFLGGKQTGELAFGVAQYLPKLRRDHNLGVSASRQGFMWRSHDQFACRQPKLGSDGIAEVAR